MLRLKILRLKPMGRLPRDCCKLYVAHPMHAFIMALSVLLTVWASSASADSIRSVSIGGVGRDPCSAWVLGRATTTPSAEAASQTRIEWISGFLSAVNVFADRSGNLKGGVDDPDGVIRWIDKYCGAHPTDPLWTAAGALVLDLKNSSRE